MRWVLTFVYAAGWLWIGYDLFRIVWPLNWFLAIGGALACLSVAMEIIFRRALEQGGKK